MLFSKVTGYIKDKFRGGEKVVSISKVKALNNDSQVLHCFAPGIEVNPADGSNLVLAQIGGFTVAVGGVNQEIEPDVERGEIRFYSTDDAGKIIKAIIKFKADGTLELNGATDSAVKFAELKSGFDSLKSDFNSFLTHVHGLSGTPPVPPALPSTASVDSSESADVKIS